MEVLHNTGGMLGRADLLVRADSDHISFGSCISFFCSNSHLDLECMQYCLHCWRLQCLQCIMLASLTFHSEGTWHSRNTGKSQTFHVHVRHYGFYRTSFSGGSSDLHQDRTHVHLVLGLELCNRYDHSYKQRALVLPFTGDKGGDNQTDGLGNIVILGCAGGPMQTQSWSTRPSPDSTRQCATMRGRADGRFWTWGRLMVPLLMAALSLRCSRHLSILDTSVAST
jgi:hypothetical protein